MSAPTTREELRAWARALRLAIRRRARQALCRHVWVFEQRLPALGGVSAVQARCLWCSAESARHEPKIIG